MAERHVARHLLIIGRGQYKMQPLELTAYGVGKDFPFLVPKQHLIMNLLAELINRNTSLPAIFLKSLYVGDQTMKAVSIVVRNPL